MTLRRESASPPIAQRHHDAYANPLGGGFQGYQAACWDCDWHGPVHLRGDEPMGTEESRVHKRLAKQEAAEHSRTHVIPAGRQGQTLA